MHDDLRRRALESGKTVSGKARSKQGSRSNSRPTSATHSRSASRPQSRDGSDDDEMNGNLSDDTNQSINYVDEFLATEDGTEMAIDVVKQQLADTIAELIERKGSTSKGREAALATYVRFLTVHFVADVVHRKIDELLSALTRSVKAETTERETVLALRALALTALTYASETLYDSVGSLIKKSVSDSPSMAIKAAAIYSLGACTSFGGAGEDEIAENMVLLLEIVQSDGAFVEAEDSAEVVTAALHTYGFLATQVDDVEDESEDAIAAFLDQLDSSSPSVQIAAGEDIALLYEKSFTPAGDNETTSDVDEHDDGGSSSSEGAGDPALVKQYNAFHNKSAVAQKVAALASLSTKAMTKRDKRNLHQVFTSVAITVDNPKLGLQTSSGTKMTVRIHTTGEMHVDRWWKLLRLNALKRLLGGGYVNHYFEGNKQVLDALPIILRDYKPDGVKWVSKASKGKYTNARRFVSGELA